MAYTEVKHSVYGRGKVDSDELASSDPFVLFHITTPRETADLTLSYMVGKVALDNKGGYVQKKRQNATRIEQYLPLVNKAVSVLRRPQDDWDELYAVGSVALVEADTKFNKQSNYAFASYAKPYIMGYIKNHINPTRNGDMNMLPLVAGFDEPAPDTRVHEDVWHAFYRALEHMTRKQQQVMKGLYIEGHSLQNVADIMGIAKPTAQDLQRRAMVHVRKKLGS